MIDLALKKGWRPDWTAAERREVIEAMLSGIRDKDDKRGMVAAARVLATLERNIIADERNQIAETGQDLAAQTDILRAALTNPAARAAMASLASVGTQVQPESKETAIPAITPEREVRVEVHQDWASAGGSED